MTNTTADISPRKAAIVAGIGLLILTVCAIFAEFFVRQNLVVLGDATATANNIMAHELLFRLGIISFIVVVILDVVVAWALYVLLKPVHRSLSLIMAWFRLVYAVILGIALINFFNVLQLLSGTGYLTAFEPNQLHAEVMVFLNAFSYGWAVGLVFFGIHLSILGFLVFKSGYIPKILGILLFVAGLGYFIDSFLIFLLPDYQATIATFTFIGEALFMLWLLFKGVKIPEMKF